MDEAALQEHAAYRKARADRYIANPDGYKVCCQCLSISPASAGTCPFCGAWRFDSSRDCVEAVAFVIGTNPFPVNAGTVPRLPV